jgi:serine/threonine protein kinase
MIKFKKTLIGYPECGVKFRVIEREEPFPEEKKKIITADGIQYELGDAIGAGGMAVVYKAKVVMTGKPEIQDDDVEFSAAVKRSFVPDEQLEQALLKEVALNFKIINQGVLKPMHFCYRDGAYAMVMPRIPTNLEKIVEMHNLLPDGETPEELQHTPKFLLNQTSPEFTGKKITKRMPDHIVAYITYIIASTLAQVNGELKVIHRDISLNNILLKPNIGEIYLTDFGVAVEAGEENIIFAGKLDYTSPEGLVNPGAVDQRSDIYSLGIMAYKMLTGLGPNDIFKISDTLNVENPSMIHYAMTLALAFQSRGMVVPPNVVVKGIDKTLSDIVCRMVQTDPDRRYQSFTELVEDFERYLHRGRGPTKKSLAAYLRLKKEGPRSYPDWKTLQHDLNALNFLPNDPDASFLDRITERLSFGRVRPLIFPCYELTDYAKQRLEKNENPARFG